MELSERTVKVLAIEECYLTAIDCGLSDTEAESQVYFAAQNNPGYDSEIIADGLNKARSLRLVEEFNTPRYAEAFKAAWGLELPE